MIPAGLAERMLTMYPTTGAGFHRKGIIPPDRTNITQGPGLRPVPEIPAQLMGGDVQLRPSQLTDPAIPAA